MELPEKTEEEDLPGDGQANASAAGIDAPTETGQGVSQAARSWPLDIFLAVLIVATFVVDQVSKSLVRDNLLIGRSIPAEGFFRITHTSNTGSAFGLFPNQTTLLMLASILGIGILMFFFRKQHIPGVWLRTSLGLLLGGAAGNLADRITLGEVTDFIDIGVWPIFNFADSSVMVGLAILAWFLLRTPKETHEANGPSSPSEEEPPVQPSYDYQHDGPVPISVPPESIEGDERADRTDESANPIPSRPSDDSDAEGNR